jgi:hypothetical protein
MFYDLVLFQFLKTLLLLWISLSAKTFSMAVVYYRDPAILADVEIIPIEAVRDQIYILFLLFSVRVGSSASEKRRPVRWRDDQRPKRSPRHGQRVHTVLQIKKFHYFGVNFYNLFFITMSLICT